MENDFDKLIDRLQKSKKGDFDDEIFEQARNLIFETFSGTTFQDMAVYQEVESSIPV